VKYVIMKKGGEPGDVAINPDLVTHIRQMTGPFTDIFFGEHRVAVQGSFAEIVNKLAGENVVAPAPSMDWVEPLSCVARNVPPSAIGRRNPG
jgi:hypothetical protein